MCQVGLHGWSAGLKNQITLFDSETWHQHGKLLKWLKRLGRNPSSRWFESNTYLHNRLVRQFSWSERQPVTLEVMGSIPIRIARAVSSKSAYKSIAKGALIRQEVVMETVVSRLGQKPNVQLSDFKLAIKYNRQVVMPTFLWSISYSGKTGAL